MQHIRHRKKPSQGGRVGKHVRAGRMFAGFERDPRCLRLLAIACRNRLLRLWGLMFAVACAHIAMGVAFAMA